MKARRPTRSASATKRRCSSSAADVLDHRVREDDVEGAVLERQLERVALDVARLRDSWRGSASPRAGRPRSAAPATGTCSSKKLSVPQLPSLTLSSPKAKSSTPTSSTVVSGRRRHRLHEEAELAPARAQRDPVGEPHQDATVRCGPVIEDVVRPRGPVPPAPDDVRPRARAAAPGGAAGRPGSAGRARPPARARRGRASRCCASASRSTPTRPSSRGASATTRCSAPRSGACTGCGRCGGRPSRTRCCGRSAAS